MKNKTILTTFKVVVASAALAALSGCDQKGKQKGVDKDEKADAASVPEKPEVTAESLGLAAGTEELGKDPYGRYWFVLPGGLERRVYDTKSKQLLLATKNADGKWEIGEPVSKP